MVVVASVVNQVVSGTVVYSVPPVSVVPPPPVSVAPAALMSPVRASGVRIDAATDFFTKVRRFMDYGVSSFKFSVSRGRRAGSLHRRRQRLPPLLGHLGVGVLDLADEHPRPGIAGRAGRLGGQPAAGGDWISLHPGGH